MVACHLVARRYALALFSLSLEDSMILEVRRNFNDLTETLKKNEVLHRAFHAPIFSAENQIRLIAFMSERGKWQKHFQNFLHVLCANRRLSLVHDVFSAYHDLVEIHENRASAMVTAATELTGKDKQLIEKAIGKRLGVKKVLLEEKIDTTLLGGFIVEVANLRMDASLRGELTRLKQHLQTVHSGL